MSKTKMILYAGLGSLVSVLIWSFIGGCHTAPDKTKETPRVQTASQDEEMPPAVETEETLVEEEVIPGDTAKEGDAVMEEEEVAVSKAPAAPAAPPSVERFHTVVKGDTLWAISREYGVSVQAIQEANSLQDAGRLSIGQKLRIP